MGTGPAGKVIQMQPIGNLRTNLSCRIVTVVLILIQLHETAIVQVVERSIEIKLVITAAHTCVMLLEKAVLYTGHHTNLRHLHHSRSHHSMSVPLLESIP